MKIVQKENNQDYYLMGCNAVYFSRCFRRFGERWKQHFSQTLVNIYETTRRNIKLVIFIVTAVKPLNLKKKDEL
jgi:hypothetical protein